MIARGQREQKVCGSGSACDDGRSGSYGPLNVDGNDPVKRR